MEEENIRTFLFYSRCEGETDGQKDGAVSSASSHWIVCINAGMMRLDLMNGVVGCRGISGEIMVQGSGRDSGEETERERGTGVPTEKEHESFVRSSCGQGGEQGVAGRRRASRRRGRGTGHRWKDRRKGSVGGLIGEPVTHRGDVAH